MSAVLQDYLHVGKLRSDLGLSEPSRTRPPSWVFGTLMGLTRAADGNLSYRYGVISEGFAGLVVLFALWDTNGRHKRLGFIVA